MMAMMPDRRPEPALLRRLGIAFAAAVIATGPPGPLGAQEPPFQLRPCEGPRGVPVARCGSLTVPEDHGNPDSRRIDLNIQVLSAPDGPGADPVFLLAGGPGQAATEVAEFVVAHLGGVLPGRSIVLVDQRGTGQSNPLRCASAAATTPSRTFGPSLTDDEVRSCRDALSAKADLSNYTTDQTVEDLEAVRRALGARHVNLVGLSYGSLLGFRYLRRHPGSVRSAVFESVAAPGIINGMPNGRASGAALDSLFAACDRDAACRHTYPRLAERLDRLLERLRRTPAGVAVGTGRDTALVDRDAFASGLNVLLFQVGTAAMIPRVIDDAERGDFTLPRTIMARIQEAVQASIATGLQLSVTCAENQAALRRANPEEAGRGSLAGQAQLEETLRQCDIWQVPSVGDDFHTPVRSDVPVLMVAGAVDPILSPDQAREAAGLLRRSRVVVVAEAGHSEISPCVNGIVARFIETADPAGVDASCTAAIRRPPFLGK